MTRPKERVLPEGISVPEGAKAVPLDNGYYALVDEEDYELVIQRKWSCVEKGKKIKRYYAWSYTYSKETKKNVSLRMHRLIMNCPDGLFVDHINHDGLDNRKCNLRICTRAENNCNIQSISKYGYKGITRERNGRFSTYLVHNGIEYSFGAYNTPEEAARAYDAGALKHHGEFALTNEMMGLFKQPPQPAEGEPEQKEGESWQDIKRMKVSDGGTVLLKQPRKEHEGE